MIPSYHLFILYFTHKNIYDIIHNITRQKRVYSIAYAHRRMSNHVPPSWPIPNRFKLRVAPLLVIDPKHIHKYARKLTSNATIQNDDHNSNINAFNLASKSNTCIRSSSNIKLTNHFQWFPLPIYKHILIEFDFHYTFSCY